VEQFFFIVLDTFIKWSWLVFLCSCSVALHNFLLEWKAIHSFSDYIISMHIGSPSAETFSVWLATLLILYTICNIEFYHSPVI
jgi:hypothetical protein